MKAEEKEKQIYHQASITSPIVGPALYSITGGWSDGATGKD